MFAFWVADLDAVAEIGEEADESPDGAWGGAFICGGCGERGVAIEGAGWRGGGQGCGDRWLWLFLLVPCSGGLLLIIIHHP
jgi:hypothetical protein